MLLVTHQSQAQTDGDAIMINKNFFCAGVMYSYGSWDEYWEGRFKRDNENMGKVSTQMIGVMGSYGITKNLNALFSVPYVQTKATGGTLKGLKGIQDLSLMLKWKFFSTEFGNGKLSTIAVGGFSFPLTNYVADFVPMSIGMRSKNLSLRGMADYQVGKFFITGSSAFVLRSNIEIDRTAYYDTEMHNTNIVDMPNMLNSNVRAGYRSKSWIAEGTYDRMNTLGGFDIRKNDMPFPSNEMDATMVGVNFKYSFQRKLRGLELTGGVKYVIDGESIGMPSKNVGQSTIFNGGVFYLMNLSKPKKS